MKKIHILTVSIISFIIIGCGETNSSSATIDKKSSTGNSIFIKNKSAARIDINPNKDPEDIDLVNNPPLLPDTPELPTANLNLD